MLLTEALKDFERYAENIWHNAPAVPDAGYFGDGKSHGNGGIRGTCGTALAYAVLIRECPNDQENTRRLKRIEAALRYAASIHEVIKSAQRSAHCSLLPPTGSLQGNRGQSPPQLSRGKHGRW